MNRAILFSMLAFLLLAGCASESQAQNQMVENVSENVGVPAQEPVLEEMPQVSSGEDNATLLEKYSGPFFVFGYFGGMETSAEEKNNSEGQPYGAVQVSGKEGEMLLFWKTYVPENESYEPTLPERFLSAFERDGDPLKLLDNSTNKSELAAHDVIVGEIGEGGEGKYAKKKVAEMSFEKDEGGAHLYCYALEYYEPELDIMVSVRIASYSAEDAKLLRDAFFQTFMFSNWVQIIGSN